jgi:hypothetical protein
MSGGDAAEVRAEDVRIILVHIFTFHAWGLGGVASGAKSVASRRRCSATG